MVLKQGNGQGYRESISEVHQAFKNTPIQELHPDCLELIPLPFCEYPANIGFVHDAAALFLNAICMTHHTTFDTYFAASVSVCSHVL